MLRFLLTLANPYRFSLTNPRMKKHSVLLVKETALNLLTQETMKRREQQFHLYADSEQAAHLEANRLCTLPLDGQQVRVFIDGKEHSDERL
jgi:hypothetical protein